MREGRRDRGNEARKACRNLLLRREKGAARAIPPSRKKDRERWGPPKI